MADRLGALDPDLGSWAESAREDLLADLAVLACRRAAALVESSDVTVAEAIERFGRGDHHDMAAVVAERAASLDERYFDAHERGEPGWDDLFHQARLTDAVALLLRSSGRADLRDVIYEAAHAAADPKVFIAELGEAADLRLGRRSKGGGAGRRAFGRWRSPRPRDR